MSLAGENTQLFEDELRLRHGNKFAWKGRIIFQEKDESTLRIECTIVIPI